MQYFPILCEHNDMLTENGKNTANDMEVKYGTIICGKNKVITLGQCK